MLSLPTKVPDHSSAPFPQPTALEESFPSVMLSEVGTAESWRKEVHRPATSTHKWWAKRLGSVFRGIMCAASEGATADVERAYSSPLRLDGCVVLDPFAGSGVIGVEAAKLGAKAVCFDINPVATLVQRQALNEWDVTRLTNLYRQVEENCRAEIDRVHKTEDGRTVLYYFWVAQASCPQCAVDVPLFDETVFSRNAYPKRVPRAQLVCPICLEIQEGRYDFTEAVCSRGHKFTQQGPVSRGHMTCINGHVSRILDALGGSRPRLRMYAKMVVSSSGTKSYEGITAWDEALYEECERLLAELPPDSVLPQGELSEGNNTAQAMNWGFKEWRHFFNARQLYSLSILATAIRNLPGRGPEREALCALFSGTLEFNNMFASFKGEGTGAVRHMFSNHVLKPERTPLEAHPWGTPQSSGSFSTLLKSRILRADEYKRDPSDLVLVKGKAIRRVGLSQQLGGSICEDWPSFADSRANVYIATRNSAQTDLPDRSVDLVVTDPPYMDNVHYAELADFFHAWLSSLMPFDSYPREDTTRKRGEVQNADPKLFGQAIEAVWRECHRVLKPGGLLAFSFHQARVSCWIEVVTSLTRAGFVITAIQPVKGEMSTSIVKGGSREPSNLDSIVICRRSADNPSLKMKSIQQARDAAVESLIKLRDEGLDVGIGDIRSVARGAMLAYLASSGADPEAHLEDIETMAGSAIEKVLSAAA